MPLINFGSIQFVFDRYRTVAEGDGTVKMKLIVSL